MVSATDHFFLLPHRNNHFRSARAAPAVGCHRANRVLTWAEACGVERYRFAAAADLAAGAGPEVRQRVGVCVKPCRRDLERSTDRNVVTRDLQDDERKVVGHERLDRHGVTDTEYEPVILGVAREVLVEAPVAAVSGVERQARVEP